MSGVYKLEISESEEELKEMVEVHGVAKAENRC